MTNLPKVIKDSFPDLEVTQEDSFTVTYKGGILEASITRPDGTTFTRRKRANGNFQEFTAFNPKDLTLAERRDLAHELYTANSMTQREIATKLGVSQSTVSNYIRNH